MKQSKFNIIIETKNPDTFIIYNSLKDSILKIDKETLDLLNKPEETKDSPDINETKKNLINQGFLIEDHIDENKIFSVRMGECKYGGDKSEIMINLTYACNLACPYCFEGKREFKDMTDENYNKIISFIKNMGTLHRSKHMELHLFGGEPLVRPKKTFQIIEEIKRWSYENKMKFSFIIYTNGTICNDYIIKNFLKHKDNIRYIHFTLDGPKEVHDKRRVYRSGKGSYEEIINTLKEFKKNNLYSVIRINVDRNNYNSITQLFEDLKKENLNDIPIGFSFIRDMTHSCGGYKGAVSDSDPQKWLPDLWEKALSLNFNFVIKPEPSYLYCGAFKNSSFIIDIDGSVYKCAGLQGIKGHKIGNINEKGLLDEINYNYYEFMSRDPFSIVPCKDCKVLPLCGGGCASCSFTRYKTYHKPNCFDRNIALVKERIKFFLLSQDKDKYKDLFNKNA